MSDTLIIPDGSQEWFLFFGTFRPDNRYYSQPLIGGISEFRPGYRVERECYYAHELIIPQQGELVCNRNGVDRVVRPNEALFLPSQSGHIYGSNSELRMLWFHILPYMVCNDQTPDFFVRQAQFPVEISLLCQLLHMEERRHCDNIAATAAKLWDYIKAELSLKEQEHRYYSVFEQVYDCVRQRIDEPWSVADMAQLACLSESHFYALSQEIYGSTPHDILKGLRMQAASAMLLRTGDDLDRIAARVGYADRFSFSKAFRKHYQCSPRDFRANSKRKIAP